MDVTTYRTQAEEAIKAGDLDKAEMLIRQAELAHRAGAIKAEVVEAGRLLPAAGPVDAHTSQASSSDDIAAKSWYINRFGDDGAAMNQVMSELYGRDHQRFAWAKSADFMRYVRTGQYDPQLHRALVYTPAQIAEALADGVSVAALKATQVESQDVLGGYLVPEDVRDQIVQRLAGLTAVRSIAQTITTTRDRVVMPVGTGGDDRYSGAVRATWVDESPTSTQAETNGTFGQVVVPVHTLMAHVPVSKNLIEDSTGASSILAYLTAQFADAFAIKEDEAFLIGDGAGKPQGFLQNATTGGPWTYAYGSVQQVNSGNATALTGDAFRNTPYALATQYRNQGCAWIMARGTVRVIKSLKDGSGAYLWGDRQFQLQNGQPTKLEGYDILESEALASPTTASGATYTANVYPVIFAARGSYLIADRIGMDVMRYDDSTTGVANAIRLVARRRLGGQVLNPWAVAVMKVSA